MTEMKVLEKNNADMDLIGLPYQIIIGPRDLKEEKIEIKDRANKSKESIDLKSVVKLLTSKF